MRQSFLFNALRKTWLTVKYAGNKHACPNCGHGLRALKEHGLDNETIKKWDIVGARRAGSAKCPFCGTTERDRLVYAWLSSQTFTDGLKHVLHIAPEPLVRKFFTSKKDFIYYPGDKFEPGYAYADCLYMDIAGLPFKTNTFDVIVCNHVLEHVDNLTVVLDELNRVMKENGIGVFQVPISFKLEKTFEDSSVKSNEEREKVFGQKDHVRLFGNDYPSLLAKRGFKVTVIEQDAVFSEKYAPLKLNPVERLFIVKKCVA